MFAFKSKKYELLFQEDFAERHKALDFWLAMMGLLQYPIVLWNYSLHCQAQGKDTSLLFQLMHIVDKVLLC